MITITGLSNIKYQEWLALWSAYLEFYKTELNPQQAALTFKRLSDASQTDMFGYAIIKNQNVVGIVHLLSHASTWTKLPYCYLQDLFIDANYRNQGLATKLIEFSYDECKNNYDRVYWLTHKSNDNARLLYNRVATETGFIQYKKSLN